MTAERAWKVYDYIPGGMPAADLADDERAAVAKWLELLAVHPRYAGGVLLPAVHLGNTLAPDDPDYEAPIENLWSADIPGTDWRCRYQVHYDHRTVHLVGFQREPRY